MYVLGRGEIQYFPQPPPSLTYTWLNNLGNWERWVRAFLAAVRLWGKSGIIFKYREHKWAGQGTGWTECLEELCKEGATRPLARNEGWIPCFSVSQELARVVGSGSGGWIGHLIQRTVTEPIRKDPQSTWVVLSPLNKYISKNALFCTISFYILNSSIQKPKERL